MAKKKAPWRYTVWYVLCICGSLNLAGCSSRSRPKLVPVSGKVTLDGEPLINKITRDGKPLILDNNSGRHDYTVIFYPDPAKGNKNPWTCEGRLSSQSRTAGEYILWTQDFLKARASRGMDWTLLKRNALTSLDGSMWERHDSGNRQGAPLGWYKVTIRPEWDVPEVEVLKIRKYLKVDKTPLSIEVVETPEPGHYDVTLEK